MRSCACAFCSAVWAPQQAGFPSPSHMVVIGPQGWQQFGGHCCKETTVDFGKDRLIPHCPLEGYIVFQVHELQLSEDIVKWQNALCGFVQCIFVCLFLPKLCGFSDTWVKEMEGERTISWSAQFVTLVSGDPSFLFNLVAHGAATSVPGQRREQWVFLQISGGRNVPPGTWFICLSRHTVNYRLSFWPNPPGTTIM